MKRLSQILISLSLFALIVSPFALVQYADAASIFNPEDLINTDKLIPNGLISDKYRKEVEKSFKKGVAACAVISVVLYAISNIPGLKVPVERLGNDMKVNFLDCVAYHVVNMIIEDMLRSLTVWVQNGFKGNPIFVSHMDAYMRNLADQIAGQLIAQVAPFLCSPFRLQIQLQLILAYKESRDGTNPICTLTGSLQNIQDFANGDFTAGGWDSWYQTWSNPYNNPYGAYIETTNALAAQLDAKKNEATLDITLGSGFLSRKRQTCYVYPSGDGAGPPQQFTVGDSETLQQAKQRQGVVGSGDVECDEPEIVTPGKFIQDTIANKYKIPNERLAVAGQSINQLIGLLLAVLDTNISKDEGGLAHYKIPSGDEAQDLLDPTLIDDVSDGGNDSTPGDSEAPGPKGASVCFEQKGRFLVPTHGGGVTAGFTLTPPQNTSYDRFELGVDITNNGWPEDREGWPVEVFWLGRPANKDLFGYSKVNAPNSNVFLLRHGIGQSFGFKPKAQGKLDWPEGATYHFAYVYDAQNKKITLSAIDMATGKVVRTLSSTPDVPGINVGNKKFNVGFGYSETEANPKERPMYGWNYANMKASFISNGTTPSNCSTPSPWDGSPDFPH